MFKNWDNFNVYKNISGSLNFESYFLINWLLIEPQIPFFIILACNWTALQVDIFSLEFQKMSKNLPHESCELPIGSAAYVYFRLESLVYFE